VTTRVGIVSRTATYGPLYRLADKVELVELGSTAAGVDALLERRIDVAATCPDALIASAAPLRIGAGLIDRPPTSLVAAQAVRATPDLRGKRVGTTSAQGSVSIFLRAALREGGLARGDYVEVVCGPTPTQADALERGDVDAAMLTAPFDARLAARGFRILADVGALLGPCAFTTLNVRAGWTATEAWRSLIRDLGRAIRDEPGPLPYDLRVDPRSIDRLIALMRADGIGVARDVTDLLAEGVTASPSP
jgi:ABC-type nitrate/sulfonate/bicarbonate transport system substrate-binding protein